MGSLVKSLLQPIPFQASFLSKAWTVFVSISIGLLIQLGVNFLCDRPLIFAFFASALFVSWRSGFSAGLLTVFISCVVAQFFIFEPRMTLHWPQVDDFWTLVSFAVVSVLGVWFTSQSAANASLTSHAQTELQMTLKSIGDGVLIVDANRCVTFLNPVAEKLTGWTNEKASRIPMDQVFKIFNESTRKPAFNPVDRVIKEGIVMGLVNHTVLLAKDGSEYQIEDSAAPIRLPGNNKVAGVILVFRDVTAKYAEEKKSKEARQKFEAVIAELSDGVVLSDGDGGSFQMNKAALALHGFNNELEMLDHLQKYPNLFKLETVDRKFLDPADWPLTRVLRGERFHDFEAIVTRLDTKHSFVGSYSGTPIFDRNGKVLLAILTLRDCSEKLATETQLRRAKDEAEIASTLKTTFLANMSHEIRTPLGAILGFTELMRDSISSADRAEYADIISRNGNSLTKIIDDILDLSKVEAGKLVLEKIDFNLKDLIDEVKILFMDTVDKKGIEFKTVIDPKMPSTIKSDPTRIRQILINLIGNAVKFTSKGSVNVLTTPIFSERRLVQVQFTVSDTGVGMDSEQATNLFKAFSQADNSTTRKFGGTGLGLALSKRLALALGGDVIIDSSISGKGSVFVATVAANAAKNNYTTAETKAVTDTPDLTAVQILLVEDSIDNQFLIKKILARYGIQVEVANNGLEAIEKISIKNFDIILMDMQMPVLDGYAATEQLRKNGYKKPIIALTAHAMAEEKRRTKLAGCDAHLVKPLDSALLVKTIVHFWQNG